MEYIRINVLSFLYDKTTNALIAGAAAAGLLTGSLAVRTYSANVTTNARGLPPNCGGRCEREAPLQKPERV